MPDPIETLKAAETLVQQGFVVLPYCGADPVLCKRLEEVGCAAVMPLGAPIGSNQGLETRAMLEIIIQRSRQFRWRSTLASAFPAMPRRRWRWGADAVLVNTAIAIADDPVNMAKRLSSGSRSRPAGASSPDRVARSTFCWRMPPAR
ncbi:hypothetical protein MF573_01870 [Klebsiella pneumoniae]|nr:hypothetical protein MF573_01870 [Klebsiella pneumoniae]